MANNHENTFPLHSEHRSFDSQQEHSEITKTIVRQPNGNIETIGSPFDSFNHESATSNDEQGDIWDGTRESFEHERSRSSPGLNIASTMLASEQTAQNPQADRQYSVSDSEGDELEVLTKRAFRKPKGVLMPMLIDMDEAGNSPIDEAGAQDDLDVNLRGKITYEAEVYNLDMESAFKDFAPVAVARYITKTAFNPKSEFLRRSKSATEDAQIAAKEQTALKFVGDVFKIRYRAKARMPWLHYSYQKKDIDPIDLDAILNDKPSRRKKSAAKTEPPATIYNHKEVPKHLSEHDITYWSNSSLVIKSTHLMFGLYGVIKHWPTLFNQLPKIDSNWELEIPYPYSMLLHHYEAIGNFRDGINETSLTVSQASVDREYGTEKDEFVDAADLDIAVGSAVSKVFGLDHDPVLAKEHLALLHQFLTPIYEAKVPICEKMKAEPIPKVPFDSLWYFFKPGTIVYAADDWTPWFAAVVDKCIEHPHGKEAGARYLQIDVWFLSSDGATIARCPAGESIFWYAGVKALTDLHICPAEIWDKVKGDSRRKEAIKRGSLLEKAFRNNCLLAKYSATESTKDLGASGKVVVDHQRGQDMTGLEIRPIGLDIDPRDIYADWDSIFVNEPWGWGSQQATIREGFRERQFKPVKRTNPYAVPGDPDYNEEEYDYSRSKRTRKSVPLSAQERTSPEDAYSGRPYTRDRLDEPLSGPLTDEQRMLIYPLTFGFSLKTKIWIELDASRLEEISATRESLDNLVIPEPTMRTIEALAHRLKRKRAYSADHIADKGSGGIVLLHGPPGVGKTYTVEAIAEMLHRPLLALTVGDIGTKETMIELELAKWFALADLWEAVLLIDEADIFLERRQTRDLHRNGLVSAFLRRAEYFDGLLFLTTNRVGQIDDAFISRVHVAIRYNNLEGKDLARIWEGFFKKVAKDENIMHKIIITPKTRAWVTQQSQIETYKSFNGRDIRNALQTAITLAEFEHQENVMEAGASSSEPVYVEREHFERVLELTSSFRNYVDSIRRKDQAGRAGERGDRNDYLANVD